MIEEICKIIETSFSAHNIEKIDSDDENFEYKIDDKYEKIVQYSVFFDMSFAFRIYVIFFNDKYFIDFYYQESFPEGDEIDNLHQNLSSQKKLLIVAQFLSDKFGICPEFFEESSYMCPYDDLFVGLRLIDNKIEEILNLVTEIVVLIENREIEKLKN